MLYFKFPNLFLVRRLVHHIRPFNRTNSDVTAGIIIIGDEILKGQTQDTNSAFLIKNLNKIGLKICKVTILPDDVDIIANEVLSFSQNCSVVLTSGGVGPTHDDVTFEAVAKACGETLTLNSELCTLFSSYFGPEADKNPAVMKFSSIPTSAKLHYGVDNYGNKTKFPLISTRNIYMLPGVPMLLQKSFDVFKTNFLQYNKPHQTKNIFITLDEFSVTPVLNDAVKSFEGKVKFGSYPSFNENYFKVKLTLESFHECHIKEASDYLEHQLPKESIVQLKDDFLFNAPHDLDVFCNTNPSFHLAVSVIEKALKQYPPSEICICFNGGKDCTALLHLLYCCIHKLKSLQKGQIHALHVKNGETFREVDDFIHSSTLKYQLNLSTIEGDLKSAFGTFLQAHSHIKAIFMGTRRCDPGAENLKQFSTTDEDWPLIMRVLPILDWTYTEVWTFIRSLQIPYCTLYDRGYTSLGLKSKTKPNPALLVSEHRGFRSYKPAYMLVNRNEERHGRT